MTDFKHRLPLKGAVVESDLFQFARVHGWILEATGDPESDFYINIWVTRDENAEIHYVEDPLIGLSYITIRGEEADSVAEIVQANCAVWSLSEALRALRSATTRDERLTAVYVLALAAPERQDPAIVDEFRSLAEDPDPGIRQSIVVAVGYLPWSGLVEIVRRVRDADRDDFVRENARIVLEGIERLGGQS